MRLFVKLMLCVVSISLKDGKFGFLGYIGIRSNFYEKKIKLRGKDELSLNFNW